MDNRSLSEAFAELAALTKIEDGSPQSFRVRAYESAAKTLATLATPASAMSETELVGLKGIGKSSAKKIQELLVTGHMAKLDELRAKYPPEFLEIVRVPGLGPKTAVLIRERLGVETIDDLKAAIAAEQLRELPGLGAKSEEKLAHAIDRLGLSGKDRRAPIIDARREARRVVRELETIDRVERVGYCGSLRRFRETIGDLDVLVAAEDGSEIMKRVVQLERVAEVIGSGDTKTSVRAHSGLQIDVRVVPVDSYGAAQLYFTGSKDHNIRLRQLAIDKGWILNEYALADADTGDVIASATEDEIYAALGLPWIPPPMREDTGEIERALAGDLPNVVTEADIRGDLHVHTALSGDADDALEAMLAVARDRGLEYVAITDHAEDLAINGATRDEMLEQRAHIHEVQADLPDLRILHGVELNIGPDGSLDYDPEFLAGYDWCVASVHSHFDLDPEAQTVRILQAMREPSVNAIGHLTGRRIGKRPGIEIDLDAVLEGAEITGTAIEINSHLDRLDAGADVLRAAMARDVTFVISTDSHRVGELGQIRWGVHNAQRGWVTADRVANTWPTDRFMQWVETQRA